MENLPRDDAMPDSLGFRGTPYAWQEEHRYRRRTLSSFHDVLLSTGSTRVRPPCQKVVGVARSDASTL